MRLAAQGTYFGGGVHMISLEISRNKAALRS
jgi:hypothetical protein